MVDFQRTHRGHGTVGLISMPKLTLKFQTVDCSRNIGFVSLRFKPDSWKASEEHSPKEEGLLEATPEERAGQIGKLVSAILAFLVEGRLFTLRNQDRDAEFSTDSEYVHRLEAAGKTHDSHGKGRRRGPRLLGWLVDSTTGHEEPYFRQIIRLSNNGRRATLVSRLLQPSDIGVWLDGQNVSTTACVLERIVESLCGQSVSLASATRTGLGLTLLSDGAGPTLAEPAAASSRNPFNPFEPATPPGFTGRQKTFRHLHECLNQRGSVNLFGDRHIGKTSIIRAFAEIIRQAGRDVCVLTGEGPEGAGVSAFVTAVTGIAVGNDVDHAADVLRTWAVQSGRNGPTPVIVFDEFDKMVLRWESRFFERLRGMTDRVSFILATTMEIDRLCDHSSRLSLFHNKLTPIPVGLLDAAEAQSLVERGGSLLTPEDREQIATVAGRHPFFIQLLGYHIFDAKLRGASFQEGYDSFQVSAAGRLRDLWRRLSTSEKNELTDLVHGKVSTLRSLRIRGLTTDTGEAFGRVLVDWVRSDSVE